MSKTHRIIKVVSKKELVLKMPLFPIDVECLVSGFAEYPEVEFRGYFRRVLNHGSAVIFQYEKGFRIASYDYNETQPLKIFILQTRKYWDYFVEG